MGVTSSPIRWIYQWPALATTPEFRLGRAGDEIIAEWIGLGSLHANVDGTQRDLRATGSVTADALEDALKPHVAALLRHLAGGISLHASSVSRAGAAIAFLGSTCAGKSTIATQLCDDPDVELVSDDTAELRFEGAHVAIVPGETDHSLRPDVAIAFGLDPHGHRKLVKPARRSAATAPRLCACITLVFDNSATAPVLRRVHGAEAFNALSLSTVRFVLDDEDVLRRELDNLARVAEQAPIYELRRARDLSTIHTSARQAAQLLRSLSGGHPGP